jgi:uncharacterized 2Fe-2S/4Fe-4S cluster protein (DUF4445 family)
LAAESAALTATYTVTFGESPDFPSSSVKVPKGTLLSEAAGLAGLDIFQPCGGQGRCGRCVVQVKQGSVRRRSTLRLSAEDIVQGYALACQTVVEGDTQIFIPQQEKIERRLSTDRVAAEIEVPASYDWNIHQTLQRVRLTMHPPTMDDQIDDWSRLQNALNLQAGFTKVTISLDLLRKIGPILRQGNWEVTAVLELYTEPGTSFLEERLIALYPSHNAMYEPLWGAAIDIGTTTVSLWLVDLITGRVHAQASEYNGQIARGEDVISRIIYAAREHGADELRQRVLDTINTLIDNVLQQVRVGVDREVRARFKGDNDDGPNLEEGSGEEGPRHEDIVKVTIAGNTTMIHLILGIPASSIRLSPFIPAINIPPSLRGCEVGLKVNPEAEIDCLPGVASYVGADITAGVLSTGMDESPMITLFIDVGTNGEIVFGSRDWLVSCACSAGPAFEGAGVVHGMRATRGAIEEVWVAGADSPAPYEPSYRVIGRVKPRGLCGSGLISLIAEMFVTGVLDKAGNIKVDLDTPRTREGEHGPEYVVAWGAETETGQDLVITRVDIDNLLRAKAAIYAGFTVLAESVGIPLEHVEQLLIGGSFGKYINIEKAVQIGLLPDIPWERVRFLGNTSIKGAYHALLNMEARQRLQDIASRMTYIELSADNMFYDSFMSALFLPHTDLWRFPSVQAMIDQGSSAG